jgi:C4-dicarboxylate transporter DctM subunit
MSPATVCIIGFCLFFVLIFLNMPIGFVMALVGFVGFGLIRGFDPAMSLLSVQTYRTASDFILGAIPLFIAMGFLAMHLGLSTDLFYVMNKWIGQFRGGLAMAATGACSIFAAICGDAVATAAAVGVVALPQMRKNKYADVLSAGVLASAGNLGFLIPPSLALLIYAVITEQSIGTLFAAGILPGLLLAAFFVITIWLWCRINPKLSTAAPPASWGERFRSLRYVSGSFLVIVLVLGGIYGGIFTPTEAAAIGVFGVILVGFIFRRVTWQRFADGISDTALLTGKIFILITGARIFMRLITVSEIPLNMSETIAALQLSPYIFLVMVLVFYIIMGFVADILAIILITVPVLHPVLVGMGFDPVWISILIVVTVLMGMITPPVGIVVFALSGVFKDVPIYTIFRGVLPFFGAMIVALIFMVAFPQIVLFLPNLLKPG